MKAAAIIRTANTAAICGHVQDALYRLAKAIETEYPDDISLRAMILLMAKSSPKKSRAMQRAVNGITGGRYLATDSTKKGE